MKMNHINIIIIIHQKRNLKNRTISAKKRNCENLIRENKILKSRQLCLKQNELSKGRCVKTNKGFI